MYTNTGAGLLNGFSAIGNVSFDNGSLSALTTSANLGNLGQPLANNMQIMNNMTYFAPSLSGANLTLGSGPALTAPRNYAARAPRFTPATLPAATINPNT